MIIDTDKVIDLINDTKISGYAIHKSVGIHQSVIGKLRNSDDFEKDLSNLSVDTLMKLQTFIDKQKKHPTH